MVKKTVDMLKMIAYIGGKQTLENRFIQILHDAETLDGQNASGTCRCPFRLSPHG